MGYRLGLLGRDIQNSLSPVLHQAAARLCGLDAVYELIDVQPHQLAGVSAALKQGRWHGINVTAPYKNWAFQHVSKQGHRAADLKAVNTISVDSKGQLHGLNTDWFGVGRLLSDLREGAILILGSGRMAETCLAWLLGHEYSDITIANRCSDRFNELKKRAPKQVKSISFDELEHTLGRYPTIINCLPRTCYDMLDSWAWSREAAMDAFVDLNYGGRTRGFLTRFDGSGRSVHDGVDALIEQGIESFVHWTGHRPGREHVAHAVKKVSLSER
ncbi:MAG: hypothetical protein CMH52_00415 [Myxococcales bacterium]|nr:hypothetical protein [Myxococcales bacterium]